jgi:hypothetical protein
MAVNFISQQLTTRGIGNRNLHGMTCHDCLLIKIRKIYWDNKKLNNFLEARWATHHGWRMAKIQVVLSVSVERVPQLTTSK